MPARIGSVPVNAGSACRTKSGRKQRELQIYWVNTELSPAVLKNYSQKMTNDTDVTGGVGEMRTVSHEQQR